MQRLPFAIFLGFVGAAALSATSAPAGRVHAAPLAGRSVWDSVYSDSQATAGDSLFHATCERCHAAGMKGGDDGPALAGTDFMSNWNGYNLGDLAKRIRTGMPPDDPGTLGQQAIGNIIAAILRANKFPAGAKPMSTEPDSLKEIKLETTKSSS